MKDPLRNLLFSIAFVATLAVVLETAARLLDDEAAHPARWDLSAVSFLDGAIGATHSDTMFCSDDALVWKLKAEYRGRRFVVSSLQPLVVEDRSYSVATNSLGFRDDEFDIERARGRFLIPCLGDSTTFGLNVDQDRSYPARLQENLERLGPGRFRVWNGGVPGYTSVQGVALLEQMPFPRAPDLVLLAYGHNDNALYQAHFEQMSAMLGERRPLDALRAWLDRSAAYRAYKRLLVSIRDRFQPEVNLPTVDSYREMIRQAERLGADVWLLAMNNLSPDVHAAIRRAADASGNRWVDFAKLFSENGGEALMSEEIHPNEAGYAFMAEVLAREISQEDALKKQPQHLTSPDPKVRPNTESRPISPAASAS